MEVEAQEHNLRHMEKVMAETEADNQLSIRIRELEVAGMEKQQLHTQAKSSPNIQKVQVQAESEEVEANIQKKAFWARTFPCMVKEEEETVSAVAEVPGKKLEEAEEEQTTHTYVQARWSKDPANYRPHSTTTKMKRRIPIRNNNTPLRFDPSKEKERQAE